MRSDVVKKGIPAAPNRSLLYALGYTKEVYYITLKTEVEEKLSFRSKISLPISQKVYRVLSCF